MKMRIKTLCCLSLLCFTAAFAQEGTFSKRPHFTVVKQNAITPVKDQHRSGTCWDFATLGFFESEILRKTGRTYNLCEMFVVNKDYLDCATHYVRMHGLSDFTDGGSADDVLDVIRTHGICPEEAMPSPGSLVGDSLANFETFFPLLTATVKRMLPPVSSTGGASHKEAPRQGWRDSVQTVIDNHVGRCPASFTYEGKVYTPQSFAQSLGLDWDDYVSLTSFTHHPFYKWFIIEAPYKWRLKPSYNLPIDELMDVLDRTLMKGYCVAWGGDVSGGFTANGLAWLPSGTTPTQTMRQEQFDNWTFTYDHVMLLYGIAKDEQGNKYYMTKNSWGTSPGYDGIWYMSADYVKLNTTYLFLNRKALPKKLNAEMKRHAF